MLRTIGAHRTCSQLHLLPESSTAPLHTIEKEHFCYEFKVCFFRLLFIPSFQQHERSQFDAYYHSHSLLFLSSLSPANPKAFHPGASPNLSITLPVPQWAAFLKNSNIDFSLGFHPLFLFLPFQCKQRRCTGSLWCWGLEPFHVQLNLYIQATVHCIASCYFSHFH